MCAAWIGFAGAVIGGFLTLIGVFLTIQYYKNQARKEDERKNKNESIVFYQLLNMKIKRVSKILKQNEEIDGDCWIDSSEMFSREEKLMLLERTQYLTGYLNDTQILEVIGFIDLLHELEYARRDCLREMDENDFPKEAAVYFQILGDCRVRISGNNDLEGIVPIIKELKDKIK